MEAKEHNQFVQSINAAFLSRSKELGIESTKLASHCVSLWTNGNTDEYMRWFQDQSFDCVIKPEGVDTNSMSAEEIASAVRAERVAVISKWLPKMETLTLDSSESGSEVSVEPAKPEPKPEPEPEADDAIADAVAKLKRKKEEATSNTSNELLATMAERLDTLEGRLDTTEGQIGQYITSTDTTIEGHTTAIATMHEAIRILSADVKKAEAGIKTLLAAISEL